MGGGVCVIGEPLGRGDGGGCLACSGDPCGEPKWGAHTGGTDISRLVEHDQPDTVLVDEKRPPTHDGKYDVLEAPWAWEKPCTQGIGHACKPSLGAECYGRGGSATGSWSGRRCGPLQGS